MRAMRRHEHFLGAVCSDIKLHWIRKKNRKNSTLGLDMHGTNKCQISYYSSFEHAQNRENIVEKVDAYSQNGVMK